MSFSGILQAALAVAGTFDARLIIFLFLICMIGEFGLISIPYLLETIWLSSGFNASTGALLLYQLVLLWLVAQAGRQIGAALLCYGGRWGFVPVTKFYQKYLKARLVGKLSPKQVSSLKFIGGINVLSPYTVAAGRLFGLRIPLSLAVGANRRLGTNMLGILLASLIWDTAYILLGVFGGSIQLKPTQMILYSIIGLSVLYATTLMVRYLRRRQLLSREPVSGGAGAVSPDSIES